MVYKLKFLKLFITLSTFFILNSAYSQKYNTAIGVRIGTEFGITLQQYLGSTLTFEGIAQKGLFNDYSTVTLLLEDHNKIFLKGINFYYGAGPHATFYNGNEDKYKNGYGLSLIGGFELRFQHLLLSFDYKPAINFTGGNSGFESQTSLSLRYIIIKATKKKLNWKFWEKKKKKKK